MVVLKQLVARPVSWQVINYTCMVTATAPVVLAALCPQIASEQLATAQQAGLSADELSTIRVFQV